MAAMSADATTQAKTTQSTNGTGNEAAKPVFNPQAEYRKLPAVDALLRDPQVALLTAEFGPQTVTETARTLLATARATIAHGHAAPASDEWPALLNAQLVHDATPLLRPIINATGVIIHTNLGRAPLSAAARQAINTVTQDYNNLEYDLNAGRRGSRYDHAREILRDLTGAEDALVVNNCASAVYLILTALCRERDVIVSRGQLVEIGGGFRIPDVLRQSGARLVEVGTTNRTHPRDFANAITEQTAALMRIHASNFQQIGFVTTPALADLVEIARRARHSDDTAVNRVLVIDDLGSGTLLDTAPYGLAPEPMVQESVAAGADVVAFSGDKLLGGPQAGIILGKADLIAELRSHPMARALRVDKMTLAALDATLRSYQRGRALAEIPVWQMISVTREELQIRAQAWQQSLRTVGIPCTVWQGESAVGGGSLPGETLPTSLLAVPTASPDVAAARLRALELPIVCRIQQDHLLFDPRTVFGQQSETLLSGIRQVQESI